METIKPPVAARYHGIISLLLAVFFAAALAARVDANTISDAPPMAVPRAEFTATPLHNGKILVAGGLTNGGSTYVSAAVFDTLLGTWADTGSMTTPRAGHTATLLPNGKVLVAGGYEGATYKASAEIYDPATGIWTAVSNPMQVARRQHTATLLNNGLVLIVGGGNSAQFPTAGADLYDPATNAFTSAASLTTGRDRHTATLLADGKVLVFGGHRNGTVVNTAEIYNPANNSWTTPAATGTGRWFHSATLLNNGKVLLAGGQPTTGATKAVELFDPSNNTFTTNAAPNQLVFARARHTATLLPNGKVLLLGGMATNPIAAVELYDPATNVFTQVGGLLPENRSHHAAALLPNGRVLITGGFDGLYFLGTSLFYDSATGSWTATGGYLNTNLQLRATTTLMPNGRVLNVGGAPDLNIQSATAAATEYVPSTGTWLITNPMSVARTSAGAVLLSNGKVLVYGGSNSSVPTLASAELYDPTTRLWSTTGSMNVGRVGGQAVVLPNGRVFVAGGYTSTGGVMNQSITAEIYDPQTGVWTPCSQMGMRVDFSMTLLNNGKVLAAGGRVTDQLQLTNTAKLYDPAADTWTDTGSLNIARHSHTAQLLPNGNVLIISGNGTATCEIYNPTTGLWSLTGSLPAARLLPQAEVLLNGKVMLINTEANVGAFGTHVYDPRTGNWSADATFTVPGSPSRIVLINSATLLATGQILVAGVSTEDASTFTTHGYLYDEGRGALEAAQSVITTSTLNPDTRKLTLTGTGYRGLSGASSGSVQDSSTNLPFIHWRSLDSGQVRYLPVDPAATTASATTTTTATIPAFLGSGVATVVVNGVPGKGVVVQSNVLSSMLDSDGDGMSDLAEFKAGAYGFDFLKPQPTQVAKFFEIAADTGMYTRVQYDVSRETGRNEVLADPNTYDLYSSDQIQALHVDTPLIKRDASTGKFTLTLGLAKTPALGTVPFAPFAISNTDGKTTTINGAGKLEFTFPSTDNAAFYRVEAR
jgi:N-acetylneuraminic acid mutarotase